MEGATLMITRRELLLGTSMLAAASCARPRVTTTVRVVAVPYFNMSALYLADEAGYFADQGITVQIQELPHSTTAIPLLSGGGADVAFFGVSPTLINAIARGARVRIAASRYCYAPDCPEVKRFYGSRTAFPDGFTDLRQVKGKRVILAGTPGSMGEFVWDNALLSAGLQRSDVSVLPLQDADGTAVLLGAGKVDVILPNVDYDPGLTTFRDRIVAGPGASAALPNFQFSFITFGKRFLDDSPEQGATFLRAYFRAARDFAGGKTPPKFFDRLSKNGFDANVLHSLCRGGAILDGHIQLNDLQRFIDWAAARKTVPGGLRAEQLVDSQFLHKARLS